MKMKRTTIGILVVSVVAIIVIAAVFAASVPKEPVTDDTNQEITAVNIEATDVVPEAAKQQMTTQEYEKEATEPNRAKNMNIQCMVEGMLEEMPSTLYVGDGFSIYIPDETWVMIPILIKR